MDDKESKNTYSSDANLSEPSTMQRIHRKKLAHQTGSMDAAMAEHSEPLYDDTHSCPECDKTFSSAFFLHSHITHFHGNLDYVLSTSKRGVHNSVDSPEVLLGAKIDISETDENVDNMNNANLNDRFSFEDADDGSVEVDKCGDTFSGDEEQLSVNNDSHSEVDNSDNANQNRFNLDNNDGSEEVDEGDIFSGDDEVSVSLNNDSRAVDNLGISIKANKRKSNSSSLVIESSSGMLLGHCSNSQRESISGETEEGKSVSFICFECGQNFDLEQEINTSGKGVVVDVISDNKSSTLCHECQQNQAQRLKRLEGLEGKKNYCCKFCGIDCITSGKLLRHKKRVHPDTSPYRCDLCSKTFCREFTLAQHMKIHLSGEKTFKCEECDVYFEKRTHLVTHKQKHPSAKKYPCDFCGQIFGRSTDRNIHRRKHTGEKPYICKDCGKGFASNSLLTQHIKVHTGDKPHKCNFCGRAFRSTTHLSKHVRVHTGEKPYPCEECGKAFSTKSNMHDHFLRMHTIEGLKRIRPKKPSTPLASPSLSEDNIK